MSYPVTVRTYDVNDFLQLRYLEVASEVVVRGVFARIDIPFGTMVEECPVIPVYANENTARINAFRSYAYTWTVKDENGGIVVTDALCAGMGGIYNHSPESNLTNVEFKLEFRMEFWSRSDIDCGDEFTVNYGWGRYAGIRLNPVDKYLRPMNSAAIKRIATIP